MPASRADLLRPLPSLTDVRNRTPAADEELRCMSNHLVNKALLRPIEPGVPVAGQPGACGDAAPVDPSPGEPGLSAHIRRHRQSWVSLSRCKHELIRDGRRLS